MVVLVKNNRNPHQTALVTMGRPMLRHNNISGHSAFRNRINKGSNAAATGNENLANFIRGKFIIFGQDTKNSRNLLREMVNHIIRKREENQARFVNNHMALMGRHQLTRRELNSQYAQVKRNIANREQNFANLLKKIHNNPNNDTLITRRNNRLNRNATIQRIKLQREMLQNELKQNSNRATQHMRQIQAWKWVRNSVVGKV
jgi:hypothetical protein